MNFFFILLTLLFPSIIIASSFQNDESFYLSRIESYTTISNAEVIAHLSVLNGNTKNSAIFKVYVKNKDNMVMSPIHNSTDEIIYTLKSKLVLFCYFPKYKRIKRILVDETLKYTSSLLSVLNINLKEYYTVSNMKEENGKIKLTLTSSYPVLFQKIEFFLDKESGKLFNSIYYFNNEPYYYLVYNKYQEKEDIIIISNYKIDLAGTTTMVMVDIKINKLKVNFPDIYFNKNYLDKMVIE